MKLRTVSSSNSINRDTSDETPYHDIRESMMLPDDDKEIYEIPEKPQVNSENAIYDQLNK